MSKFRQSQFSVSGRVYVLFLCLLTSLSSTQTNAPWAAAFLTTGLVPVRIKGSVAAYERTDDKWSLSIMVESSKRTLHPKLRTRVTNRNYSTQLMDSYETEDGGTSLEYKSQEKEHAITLQEQAKMLREEAQKLRIQLETEKANKLAKRTAKVDSWIEKLLIEAQVDDRTQLLKNEQQVLLRLQEDRFSQEQINAIFNRICELGPQSRSNCSPLMELLVDSVGKMDEVERRHNPNKRWSGKVERILRRRLFAKDWNMDIEDTDEDDDRNPWKLN